MLIPTRRTKTEIVPAYFSCESLKQILSCGIIILITVMCVTWYLHFGLVFAATKSKTTNCCVRTVKMSLFAKLLDCCASLSLKFINQARGSWWLWQQWPKEQQWISRRKLENLSRSHGPFQRTSLFQKKFTWTLNSCDLFNLGTLPLKGQVWNFGASFEDKIQFEGWTNKNLV